MQRGVDAVIKYFLRRDNWHILPVFFMNKIFSAYLQSGIKPARIPVNVPLCKMFGASCGLCSLGMNGWRGGDKSGDRYVFLADRRPVLL